MLKTKSYVVIYRSDYGYQIAEFDYFSEAVEYCLSGQLYTSEYFIAKKVELEVKEK